MQNRDVIDRIYSAMLSESTRAEYEFNKLGYKPWGYRNSEVYQKNVITMNRNVRRLGQNAAILYGEGEYWLFDGRIYVPIYKELILSAFTMLMEHYEIVAGIQTKTFGNLFLESVMFYRPMVQSRNLIAFENGVLDIAPILKAKPPVFYEDFSPRFHVTYYHPYKYDPKAKCTKWHNFLHEVLPDKNSRVILQMFLGLGLIDSAEVYLPYEGKDAARVELCLLLIGSGGNGKSVIYRTARGVYGSERISDIPYVELTMTGDEGMRARLPLRNKIFNWSTEEEPRTFCRKNVSTFKRIVSGEPVMDRKLGGNVTKNDNLPYLVFHLNELPYPDDQSLGFIRRLQFVSFDVTVPKERRNPRLAQELITNYPGIFNWIVRGAQEVIRKKFVFPPSEGHRRQVLLSQLRTNPVTSWVNAYCLRAQPQANHEQSCWLTTAEITDSVTMYCEDNEAEAPSKQLIGQTLGRLGFYKKRFPEGNRYEVFGGNSETIRRQYLIKEEDLHVDYEYDERTYITEDD